MKKVYPLFFIFIALSFFLLKTAVSSLIIDNDSWLAKDNPVQIEEDFSKDTFKIYDENSIAITFDQKLAHQPKLLTKIQSLKNSLENNPSIKKYLQEIQTPFDLTQTFTNSSKQLVLKDSFQLEKDEKLSLAKILSLNKINPYSSVFLGKDQKSLSFKISTAEKLNFKQQKEYFQNIITTLEKTPFIKKFHIIGSSYVNYISNKKTLENLKNISNITIIIILLALFAYMRSFINVLMISVPAFLCFSLSVYMLSILSSKVTTISIVIVCTAFVIALSDSIHIFFRSLSIKLANPTFWQLFSSYIKHTFFPCFVTSFTTSVGFSSFYFSNITHLANFSIIAVPIIMINFLVVLSVTSFLLAINKGDIKFSKSTKPLFSNKLFNYKKGIILATLILTFNIIAVSQLEIEGNCVNMLFDKESKIQKDLKYFDQNFNGSMSLSLIIDTSEKNFFKNIKNYQRVTKLTTKINQIPKIEKLLTYQDQIQLIHREITTKTKHPQTRNELEQELFFLNLSRGDSKLSSLRNYSTFSFDKNRLSTITKQLSIEENKNLIKKLEKFLAEVFPNQKTFVTGSIKTNNIISSYILNTQFRSVAICVAVIFTIFIFAFSFRMALIALIPNLLPLVIALAIMKYLSIPIGLGAVLLVAITFSFCVDNTSHFMHFYSKLGKATKKENLIKTLNYFFHPFSVTTIILFIGLFSFAFSDLLFLQRFGFFSALIIILALIADLISLPIFIEKYTNKKGTKI